jgi:acyl-CoA thioesterase FadM
MEPTVLRFPVHSFDADAFGQLSPAALAGYLQEAAGRSADALGFGLQALNERGLTWVLARSQIALDLPIRWGDVLEVDTWPSGVDRLAALRDFRLRRDGAEIGRALTTWFAIDLATRRPVKPQQLLPEERHAQTPHVLAPAAAPIAAPATAEVERRFQVRFADIDANLHVTNASYVAWALEAVEEPFWRAARVAAIDIQYLAECNYGAYVRSRSAPEGVDARLHVVVREEDGKEVARARTVWAAR